MKQIYFRNGVLFYYGNPAGYVNGEKVILDSLFEKADLLHFLKEKQNLEIEIREGIYDRLIEGSELALGQGEAVTDASMLRVYQLKQDCPIMMRFIGLTEREKRGFGTPHRKEYALVYEGETSELDLENIWERFNRSPPKGFEGHSLSISDVVELTGNGVSRYFYIDKTQFIEIAFDGIE